MDLWALTRRGRGAAVGRVPCLVIGPLVFAALTLTLSLRGELQELAVGSLLAVPRPGERARIEDRATAAGWVVARALAYAIHVGRSFLVFLYLRAVVCVLGTSDGPLDIIVDCLTLMFVLELDNLLTLNSKGTLFGPATTVVRGARRDLSAHLRSIAVNVLDAGTAARRAEARREHGILGVLAVCVTVATARMQRATARGVATAAGDGDKPRLDATLRATELVALGAVLALARTRAALSAASRSTYGGVRRWPSPSSTRPRRCSSRAPRRASSSPTSADSTASARRRRPGPAPPSPPPSSPH